MVDTVKRWGIAYNFYAVPFSMDAIWTLDKKIIALQKTICGLLRSISNIITQLLSELFGLNAFSFKTTYFTCIGEQLRNALNDLRILKTIYKGLTYYILAKNGGSYVLRPLTKEVAL